MKQTYGLTGYPLGHSFSPAYFKEKFDSLGLSDYSYELFPLENINELPALVSGRPDLAGFNVTVPYKQQIIPYLDEIDQLAEITGAVNTVRIDRSGGIPVLIGSNTDVYGFRESLRPLLNRHTTKALILGNGGAAKAVIQALNQLLIPFLVVSRTPSDIATISWNTLTEELVRSYHLVIQCTPVGMNPDEPLLPFPYHAVGEHHLLYDLIYNPAKTKFLEKGEFMGARIKNGLEMLHLQADEAWRFWNS